jgi:potassium/hydrogen antiporter
MVFEYAIVVAAGLLLISVLASRATSRFGVPALVLFMVIGMLAGSDGPGGIYFDNAQLAQSLGVLALVLILFSGGLDTHWPMVRPALWGALSLSTIGVCISALLVGAFATLVLGFTLLEGVLLGAIVSSTDAAAVFAVLRTRGVNLKGRIEPLLELESGSNDPMAVFLTIGLTRLLTMPDASLVQLVPSFVLQMALGTIAGVGFGKLAVLLVNRSRLQVEGLYPALTIAIVLLTYGATTLLGGNGFLAVYLAAVVMGNSSFVHKRSLLRFHDGLAWLMQIAMFLTLGLLVYPSRLLPVIGVGVLVALFLVFVARPVSVFLSLLAARLDVNEKLMVSWVGLRGAVPIILATFPLLAGVPNADTIFNVVFFIVLVSVLLQGTSLPLVGRWLGVTATNAPTRFPQEFVPAVTPSSQTVELTIPTTSPVVDRAIVDLALPAGALIIVLRRQAETIVPSGATVLEAGDRLLIVASQAALNEINNLISGTPIDLPSVPVDEPPDQPERSSAAG